MFSQKLLCHCNAEPNKRRNAKQAAWETTDSLVNVWHPSHIPLMTKANIQAKILRLYEDIKTYGNAKKEKKSA